MSDIQTITLADYADASQKLQATIGFDGVVDLRVKNHQGITIASVYVELHDDQLKVFVWGDEEGEPLGTITVLENVHEAIARTYDPADQLVRSH